MKITFKNRELEVEALAENIGKHVTKSGKTNYYLREKTTGEWKYSHEARFNGLVKRFGSVEAISDRYLTPVDTAIISLQENHEYRYLLEKQPSATRTRKKKVEKKGPARDANGRFVKKTPQESVPTPEPEDAETLAVA